MELGQWSRPELHSQSWSTRHWFHHYFICRSILDSLLFVPLPTSPISLDGRMSLVASFNHTANGMTRSIEPFGASMRISPRPNFARAVA